MPFSLRRYCSGTGRAVTEALLLLDVTMEAEPPLLALACGRGAAEEGGSSSFRVALSAVNADSPTSFPLYVIVDVVVVVVVVVV